MLIKFEDLNIPKEGLPVESVEKTDEGIKFTVGGYQPKGNGEIDITDNSSMSPDPKFQKHTFNNKNICETKVVL